MQKRYTSYEVRSFEKVRSTGRLNNMIHSGFQSYIIGNIHINWKGINNEK